VRCATELFDKKGFFNTSLDDVAQAVGIKREALYYYYKNRTELLLAIIAPQAIELINSLEEVVSSGLPAKEKLRLAIQNHLDRFDHHCLEMTITLRDGVMGTSDPVREPMVKVWKTYEKLWTKLILEGQTSGEFEIVGDPKMVSFGILGMCNWLSRWYKPDGKTTVEELIETYFRLVSEGLLPRSSAHVTDAGSGENKA
jgi:AcrR family transcriptional regulator